MRKKVFRQAFQLLTFKSHTTCIPKSWSQMPLSVFLRSIGCKMSLERLPYMNTSIIHTSLLLFSYMPVTCWLHALGTVLKGFCSVLGLFRVAQLHAGYMSCVQITTANDRKNDYKWPQKRLKTTTKVVLAEFLFAFLCYAPLLAVGYFNYSSFACKLHTPWKGRSP